MKKGISPIVATVLLIAITVVSAMAVWFWLGNYTNQPVNTGQSFGTLTIKDCNGTSATVRNTGSVTLTANADLYKSGILVAQLNISGKQLTTGAVGSVPIVNATNTSQVLYVTGTLKILDSDYNDYTFICG